MVEVLTLKAVRREVKSKGDAKRLRTEGRIPAIYYRGQDEPVPLELDLKTVQLLLAKKPTLVKLVVDGDELECLIREVQRHPVTQVPLHVDLMGITRGVTIETTVPVILVGNPVGVRVGGGILEHVMNEVTIRCLPKNLPSALEFDVSDLEIGDSLHLEDREFEGIEWVDSPSWTVATVVAPKVITEEVAVEEEEEEFEGEVEAGAEESAEKPGGPEEGGEE
ncbi:MAG TPA: 50S ribosomal protein L25 [Bacteroidetes bacterium]|nr:50S ribosomal protein L25 [Bacteroidota bacterium]